MKQALTRILSGGLIAASLALPALAYPGQSMEKNAKIKLPEAKQIALTAQPGTVTDVELEKEAGGTGLRYSFDILPPKGKMQHEVGVDANTGKVLENSIDEGND